MTVLHLVKTAEGAAWTLRLTKELVKLGMDIHVVLPEGKRVKQYREGGVITHILNPEFTPKRISASLRNATELEKIINQVNPDIIHSYFVTTTLMMRYVLRNNKKMPKIFEVIGPLHLENPVTRRLDILTSNKRDYWLATCKWTRNCYISNGINKRRIGLTYLGVDEKDFENLEQYDIEGLRKKYKIPTDHKVVGMVAYFYSPKYYLGQKRGLKGHEDLIDAMVLVKKSFPKVTCIIIGKHWGTSDKYRKKVIQYAQKKDKELFRFLGFVKSIPEHYQLMDIAVHPSHSENLGGAVESLYNVVPTISTNVGGFPDLIKQNETGLMVSKNNPEELAEAILFMLSHPEQAKRMALEGFKHVKTMLNVKKNAKEVEAFYQQILSQSSLIS